MTARVECVLIWEGVTLSRRGGVTGGSRKGGFTGVHKKGVHVNHVNPLATGLYVQFCHAQMRTWYRHARRYHPVLREQLLQQQPIRRIPQTAFFVYVVDAWPVMLHTNTSDCILCLRRWCMTSDAPHKHLRLHSLSTSLMHDQWCSTHTPQSAFFVYVGDAWPLMLHTNTSDCILCLRHWCMTSDAPHTNTSDCIIVYVVDATQTPQTALFVYVVDAWPLMLHTNTSDCILCLRRWCMTSDAPHKHLRLHSLSTSLMHDQWCFTQTVMLHTNPQTAFFVYVVDAWPVMLHTNTSDCILCLSRWCMTSDAPHKHLRLHYLSTSLMHDQWCSKQTPQTAFFVYVVDAWPVMLHTNTSDCILCLRRWCMTIDAPHKHLRLHSLSTSLMHDQWCSTQTPQTAFFVYVVDAWPVMLHTNTSDCILCLRRWCMTSDAPHKHLRLHSLSKSLMHDQWCSTQTPQTALFVYVVDAWPVMLHTNTSDCILCLRRWCMTSDAPHKHLRLHSLSKSLMHDQWCSTQTLQTALFVYVVDAWPVMLHTNTSDCILCLRRWCMTSDAPHKHLRLHSLSKSLMHDQWCSIQTPQTALFV